MKAKAMKASKAKAKVKAKASAKGKASPKATTKPQTRSQLKAITEDWTSELNDKTTKASLRRYLEQTSSAMKVAMPMGTTHTNTFYTDRTVWKVW